MTKISTFLVLLLIGSDAVADPGCADPGAKNYVLASSRSQLTKSFEAQWVLQNTRTNERIMLRRCSQGVGDTCYFATDVPPGRYYFQEVVGRVNDHMAYPVSREGLWFDITGQGVDYIGDWTIERNTDLVVTKLEIKYPLKSLDRMVEYCKIQGKKLFLDRTNTPPGEIVD